MVPATTTEARAASNAGFVSAACAKVAQWDPYGVTRARLLSASQQRFCRLTIDDEEAVQSDLSQIELSQNNNYLPC